MDDDDWRDRFRDWDEPDPAHDTCGDCNLCMAPDDGFTDDENIGFCLDAQEFVHLDWKVDGECDSFVAI